MQVIIRRQKKGPERGREWEVGRVDMKDGGRGTMGRRTMGRGTMRRGRLGGGNREGEMGRATGRGGGGGNEEGEMGGGGVMGRGGGNEEGEMGRGVMGRGQ